MPKDNSEEQHVNVVQVREDKNEIQYYDDNNVTSAYDKDAEIVKSLEIDYEDQTVLNIIQYKLKSIEVLDLYKFKNLESLTLRNNLITSISDFEGLAENNDNKLTYLDLYDNRITHISSKVQKLTNLTFLDLSFNKVAKIKNLSKLINLKELYLIENGITKIENLEHLINLEILELGGNDIHHLENIEKLTNLKELWLGKNKLQDITLPNLNNLKILSLPSNKLNKIPSSVKNLPNLTELYLSGNKIEKIENLETLSKLEILDLNYNKIEHVENITALTSLTDLWLSYNQIDDTFKQLEENISSLPLETIYLENNPIFFKNKTSYKRKIVMIMEKMGTLEKIDADYVNTDGLYK
ncbi:L domain-like protein [Hanseniaspora valbyensis NRRL Y-1626]|uniref:L domain-like protein n=1 Tax=Hanseniaspora valbyensis NRRL Y-1626 TaxID=766949 RepID=A0A1B7TGT8_9ASCO|nr:L domain-like protein [Hanseniaspora valbyensis NRRL Y-1626]